MLHRRLVRDYEHRPASAESRVYWAISDVMARRLTGTSALARRDPQQTLGALLARLEVPERQIAVEAEAAHEQIVQLTALLDGLAQAAEHIAITRKTLLELTDEAPLAPAEPAASLPDSPAYQQIMVFAEADAPLRARNVCEAMDLNPAPNNINVRIKLKRLTSVRRRSPGGNGIRGTS
ncbi:hypothetical protein ACFWBS_37960 [Streptomyces mirabilis]|uniref:hypothetical protein n=1 Tax=Streptomyces mirabilis TaxID=68239 RepID=UPI0036688D79